MSNMEKNIFKLNEICQIKSGKRIPKGMDYVTYKTTHPYIRARDIKSGNILTEELVYIEDKVYEKIKKYIIQKGDIAITVAGSVGNTGYANEIVDGYNLTENAVRLTNFTENVDSKFLNYVLAQKHYYDYMQLIAGAAAQPKLGIYKVKQIKVELPNLEKQKKIAYILSAYDKLIDNNNKQIKLLEKMAENLYKEWFIRFHFPGYEDVAFENGIPKEWQKVKLDDVLNKIATGLNPRKNFVLGEGQNFYVTIKNMADNTVYLNDKCDKVNDDAIIKINKRSDLKIGDLLFSGIGTIGRVYLIDIPTNNWNVSESVFTMRANEKISSEFLYMLLLSQDVQNYCQSKANGSAQKGIRMGDLKKYTFLLPTKNIINNFTDQISPILRNVSLLRKENKNLIQQRDMLLPRLMSGKLKV